MKAPDLIYMPEVLLDESWTKKMEDTDICYVRKDLELNEEAQKEYNEFVSLMMKRQTAISKEDCPWSDAEFKAYKEGWNQSFMWAKGFLKEMSNYNENKADIN